MLQALDGNFTQSISLGKCGELGGNSCGEAVDWTGDVGTVIGDGIGGKGEESDEVDVIEIGENGDWIDVDSCSHVGGETGDGGSDVGGCTGEVSWIAALDNLGNVAMVLCSSYKGKNVVDTCSSTVCYMHVALE